MAGWPRTMDERGEEIVWAEASGVECTYERVNNELQGRLWMELVDLTRMKTLFVQ